MRSRTSCETLAPGVKVRDTAERETPACRATSAAVTKDGRNTGSRIETPLCTRVHARRALHGVQAKLGETRCCPVQKVRRPWHFGPRRHSRASGNPVSLGWRLAKVAGFPPSRE